MFHKNVRALRLKKSWTQRELSETSGVSKRYIQEIEAGTKDPRVGILSKLKSALQCKWDELLKGV